MKTEAFQTPSESIEAEIQKGKLEKAREEAEYYRSFLKYVNSKTRSALEDFNSQLKNTESLKNEDRTIGKILTSDLDTIIEEAMKIANEKTNYTPENEFIDLKVLKEMKPYEFIEYLEKLESSLVK